MAEPTKPELVTQAEGMGIDPEGKTKPELASEIEARQTPDLGPAVPASGCAPEIESKGSPVKGVQPVEVDQIPEAGR